MPSQTLAEASSYIQAIKNFEWFGFSNKPFLENARVPGCAADIYLFDIDRDGVDEIILQSIYAPWVIPANEVFAFKDGQFLSIGGFYGYWEATPGNVESKIPKQSEFVYKTEVGDEVILRWLEAESGGRIYQTLTQISLQPVTVTPLVAKISSYQNDRFTTQYVQFEDYKNCSREFFEGNFYWNDEIKETLKNLTQEEYENFLDAYQRKLTADGAIPYKKVAAYNLINLPAPGQLEGAALDEYLLHREDPEVLAEKSNEISEAVISNFHR